jgi:hypothetical protein
VSSTAAAVTVTGTYSSGTNGNKIWYAFTGNGSITW